MQLTKDLTEQISRCQITDLCELVFCIVLSVYERLACPPQSDNCLLQAELTEMDLTKNLVKMGTKEIHSIMFNNHIYSRQHKMENLFF